MWSAAQRFIRQEHRDTRTIIHLGDHDPSGIDMTRDIQDRLDLFGASVYVKRIALTVEQIQLYNPPPNPTKLTDARATGYINEYGYECWELDALEPKAIDSLIESEILLLADEELFQKVFRKEQQDKNDIQRICKNYHRVIDCLNNRWAGK
jgi:hypothetical protein